MAPPPEFIFYDGDCGLCHRTVQWVLRHDPAGRFACAPLGGATFQREVTAAQRAALPPSVVVKTRDGRLLTRSAATAHILAALGRRRRALLLQWTRPLADLGYRLVARLRHRLFARPATACPLVPAALRPRLLP